MNKYGAERCQGYDSKLEAAVGAILRIRERAGEIENVRRQQSVKLGTRFWKCDFVFTEFNSCYPEGETVFCEAKGFGSREWIWIKEMWRLIGPGRLEIWGGSYSSPKTIEVLEKGSIADNFLRKE